MRRRFACRGPRERHSPGPNLALNEPGDSGTQTDRHTDELHRLPIRQRVKFKVACLVRQSLSEQAPLYLARRLASRVRQHSALSLRSADVSTCVVPPTLSGYGDRTFAAAGPRRWSHLALTSIGCGRETFSLFLIYLVANQQSYLLLFGDHPLALSLQA